jgi:hypothetical protein
MTTIGTHIIIAIANQNFNQAKEFNQIYVLSMVTRQWGAFLLLVVLACAYKKGAINVIRNIVVTIKGNKEWWGGA